MGSRSLKTSPFERAVIAVLKERLQNADLTVDRLAERAGITRARCYKIFSGAATCTVTDFYAMCDALGVTGSTVAAEAERRITAESSRSEVKALPASAVSEPADSASSAGYRAKWVGVRDLPRFGPTPEEQERMAARLSDRGDLPDDWGEEPQA
jgi:hypothetical protein